MLLLVGFSRCPLEISVYFGVLYCGAFRTVSVRNRVGLIGLSPLDADVLLA